MEGMAISNIIEILGETNALDKYLNEVAMDLLGLIKDADEPKGIQRQEEVILSHDGATNRDAIRYPKRRGCNSPSKHGHVTNPTTTTS